MALMQAFWFCERCQDLRPVRQGSVTYFVDSVRIQGICAQCGDAIDIQGQREAHLAIGKDRRRLN